ncbi:hypothetical protein CC2G_012412 [Coprinopsis cinerea AmutBmut pab1-1]|nr:hypothetical protein CC2G_012412 [Coprinopsis cinerea AmutBmut pab1-1]
MVLVGLENDCGEEDSDEGTKVDESEGVRLVKDEEERQEQDRGSDWDYPVADTSKATVEDFLRVAKDLLEYIKICPLPDDPFLYQPCIVPMDFAMRNLMFHPETHEVIAYLDWDDTAVLPFILCSNGTKPIQKSSRREASSTCSIPLSVTGNLIKNKPLCQSGRLSKPTPKAKTKSSLNKGNATGGHTLSKKLKTVYSQWLENAGEIAEKHANTPSGVTMTWGKTSLTGHGLNTAFEGNCRVFTMKPQNAYLAQLQCPIGNEITDWIEITPGTVGEDPTPVEVLQQLKAKVDAA